MSTREHEERTYIADMFQQFAKNTLPKRFPQRTTYVVSPYRSHDTPSVIFSTIFLTTTSFTKHCWRMKTKFGLYRIGLAYMLKSICFAFLQENRLTLLQKNFRSFKNVSEAFRMSHHPLTTVDAFPDRSRWISAKWTKAIASSSTLVRTFTSGQDQTAEKSSVSRRSWLPTKSEMRTMPAVLAYMSSVRLVFYWDIRPSRRLFVSVIRDIPLVTGAWHDDELCVWLLFQS